MTRRDPLRRFEEALRYNEHPYERTDGAFLIKFDRGEPLTLPIGLVGGIVTQIHEHDFGALRNLTTQIDGSRRFMAGIPLTRRDAESMLRIRLVSDSQFSKTIVQVPFDNVLTRGLVLCTRDAQWWVHGAMADAWGLSRDEALRVATGNNRAAHTKRPVIVEVADSTSLWSLQGDIFTSARIDGLSHWFTEVSGHRPGGGFIVGIPAPDEVVFIPVYESADLDHVHDLAQYAKAVFSGHDQPLSPDIYYCSPLGQMATYGLWNDLGELEISAQAQQMAQKNLRGDIGL